MAVRPLSKLFSVLLINLQLSHYKLALISKNKSVYEYKNRLGQYPLRFDSFAQQVFFSYSTTIIAHETKKIALFIATNGQILNI